MSNSQKTVNRPVHKKESKNMKQKDKVKNNTNKALPENDIFLSWYEIPVLNLERAIHFYSTVFDFTFETYNTESHSMAFFPSASGVGGALVFGEGCIPSQTGSLMYLNAGSELSLPLEKVESVGGRVLMGKTLIHDDVGFYSLVLDSEGNRIALYSKP